MGWFGKEERKRQMDNVASIHAYMSHPTSMNITTTLIDAIGEVFQKVEMQSYVEYGDGDGQVYAVSEFARMYCEKVVLSALKNLVRTNMSFHEQYSNEVFESDSDCTVSEEDNDETIIGLDTKKRKRVCEALFEE
jgi:hypothetical protein